MDISPYGRRLHYVKVVAVDDSLRGTGAFRRLMFLIIDDCERRGTPIVLECHDERVVSIYSHYGFETVEVLEAEGAEIAQYCMVRHPPA